MKKVLLSCMLLLSSLGAAAQYSHAIQAEKLDRGVVAVKTDGGGIRVMAFTCQR